jgi:hypothetical protein
MAFGRTVFSETTLQNSHSVKIPKAARIENGLRALVKNWLAEKLPEGKPDLAWSHSENSK